MMWPLTQTDTMVEPARQSVTIDVEKGMPLTYELYYVTADEHVPHLMEWLNRQSIFGFDLETSAIKPRKGHIATLQFGNPNGKQPRAYVVDVRCVSREALQPVFDKLEDRTVPKLGQNIKFECAWMLHHFGVRIRNVVDTMINELVARAGLFDAKDGYVKKANSERAAYKWCSMAKLADRYLRLNIDKDKDLRTSFYSTPPGTHSYRQLAYAAGDVIYVFPIARYQQELIAKRKLKNIVKIEYGVIPVLADAEVTGIPVNTGAWRGLWQESVVFAASAEGALDDLFRPVCFQGDFFAPDPLVRPVYPKRNKPLNYTSGEQVRWALKAYCESIGWDREVIIDMPRFVNVAKKSDKANEWMRWQKEQGRPREWVDVPAHLLDERKYCVLTDADKKTLLLRMLRGQLPRDVVQLLLQYSTHEKRATGFGINWLNANVEEDGRIHTEMHQCATNTGRLSTTPNVQNIPGDARYRACFHAGKGKKFVILDYSQIEPRLSCQVSRDPTYMSAFLADDDIYLTVAAEMFGERPDRETTEGAVLRQIAKIIVLALAYRMGAAKLRDALTLGLEKEILSGVRHAPTQEEAQLLHTKFFEACTGVKEFQELCSRLAHPKDSPREKLWDDFLGTFVTYIQSPCGRIRFFAPDALNTYTEAPNAPIQGASATITKAAAVLVQRWIDDKGVDAHVVNLVHDEIVWEVDETRAEEFKHVAKKLMEQAAQFYIPDIPVKAEFPENSTGVLDVWAKKLPKPKAVEAA
jgi:DNA polymerase I-like protein with 3'-5' exonuclease and polymerase domains